MKLRSTPAEVGPVLFEFAIFHLGFSCYIDCLGWTLWKIIFIFVVSFELTIRCTGVQPVMLDPALYLYGFSSFFDLIDKSYFLLRRRLSYIYYH